MTHADEAKAWIQLIVTCPALMLEAVADRIAVITGVAVEVREDADGLAGTVLGCLTGPEPETLLSEVQDALAMLAGLFSLPLPRVRTETQALENWAESWKQHFPCDEIAPGLWIKPSWETAPAEAQRVIELDPGRAFGTGQHASTRQALTLLVNTCTATLPGRALDLGTGTGILAMTLALQGVRQVLAVDNDPEAVAVARDNVAANGLEHRILVDDTPLVDIIGPFDCICANIVHDVLLELAPRLVDLLAPGGRLVLAGILAGTQEESLLRCYVSLGLHEQERLHEAEWAALLLQAPT